jgi:hypothetical protein
VSLVSHSNVTHKDSATVVNKKAKVSRSRAPKPAIMTPFSVSNLEKYVCPWCGKHLRLFGATHRESPKERFLCAGCDQTCIYGASPDCKFTAVVLDDTTSSSEEEPDLKPTVLEIDPSKLKQYDPVTVRHPYVTHVTRNNIRTRSLTRSRCRRAARELDGWLRTPNWWPQKLVDPVVRSATKRLPCMSTSYACNS